MPSMSKIEYLRTRAKFYHPIEKGNFYVTTNREDVGWREPTSMCKRNEQRPEIGVIQGHMQQLTQRKKLVQSEILRLLQRLMFLVCNPTSIHLKAKSIYVKKEIPKEYRIWTFILGCPKCKRDSFEIRISKCVTNMVLQMERCIGTFYVRLLKGRFKNQQEKVHGRGLAPLLFSWRHQDKV